MHKTHDNIPIVISEIAVKALLYEVSATPKPGLVDRINNGAHHDMNFYTFIDSSISLGQYFIKIVQLVMNKYAAVPELKTFLEPVEFFGDLQVLGIEAESQMFKETHHVNTHKGAIYALGLITCAVSEWLCVHRELPKDRQKFIEEITERVSIYIKPVALNQLTSVKLASTYGEIQYRVLGLTGARGEAASGYLSAKKWGLPIIEEALSKGMSLNDAMVQALLVLICHLDDSNVIGRHDYETLELSRAKARSVLEAGGVYTASGQNAIKAYDLWCIEHYISHGGCADLLAVSIYLKLLSDQFCEKN
ncbi:triphosphoribosyl-dephospho-CoA synthase [Fusibacter sp. 3D3]|uniref:triphosphoribosyl-dephospho-CoA synthase n=1 Tax=Fusibacter sp. 3D3 TaxID=1048380 RepID=UPI0008529E67|nr:triphosphoribosyl-dephospho-CoA synthase [Fusibacter sp. 3D3]GAU78266.1 2-(5''-triphosphoribosyl)-3'-dephosphocoenzyme-A synthase [Fusibacter sp. 3D3]